MLAEHSSCQSRPLIWRRFNLSLGSKSGHGTIKLSNLIAKRPYGMFSPHRLTASRTPNHSACVRIVSDQCSFSRQGQATATTKQQQLQARVDASVQFTAQIRRIIQAESSRETAALIFGSHSSETNPIEFRICEAIILSLTKCIGTPTDFAMAMGPLTF